MNGAIIGQCRGGAASADLAEIRRFERLLRIWGRIDREERSEIRKFRRRRAACRLVYGAAVDTWPAFRSQKASTPCP
jgi:hypothetical protein